MTLEAATTQAESLRHYQYKHELIPYVYRTYRKHGRSWRAMHLYGVRFHKVGASPSVYEDSDYRMVPVEGGAR
jgi:type IV secretory pathway TrbF-like protein